MVWPAFIGGTSPGLNSFCGWNVPKTVLAGASTDPWLRMVTVTVNVWWAVGVCGSSVTESITRSAEPIVPVLVGTPPAVGPALGVGVGGDWTSGILEVSPVTSLKVGSAIDQPRV